MFDEEQLRREILKKLNLWVEAMPDPDKPIIGFAGGGETLSPRQIAEHVDNRTPRGEKFVQNWIRLAVNHIMDSTLLRQRETGARGVASRSETAATEEKASRTVEAGG